MKNCIQFKKILLGGAAVGMFMVPALAQQQMETVTVTGIRASLQSAQSIKQNSDQVVDSITAVDIGALPDRNIAEALQRVPGVTLQRNDTPNDLVRMGSTGNSVFIRGLSWVKSLVNGRDEFTAVAGRSLSFADVSADLMAAVNVYKSPTAGQIEGGVGGTVDLITRKPFDHDGQVIAFSGDYTYGDLVDRALPSANALYSNRFNTAIGEIGFLASVDWQNQITRTEGLNVDQYSVWNKVDITHWVSDNNPLDPTAGHSVVDLAAGNKQTATDGFYDRVKALTPGTEMLIGPKGWAWRQMEFKQQRLATNFVFQWRPSDKLEVTLFGMNTYAHNQDMEHYDYNAISYSQLLAGTFNSDSVWTSGPSTLTSIDTRGGSGHNRNSDLSLNIKFNPTDALEITADVQFVESSSPYRNMTFFTAMNTQPGTTLDLRGEKPVITVANLASNADPANYFWNAAMDHLQYNSAHSSNVRLDATYHFPGRGVFGVLKSVSAGFRTEQKVSMSRSTGYNWGFTGSNWLGASTVGLDGNLHCGTPPCVWHGADGVNYTSVTGALKTAIAQTELFHYQSLFGNNLPSLWVPSAALAGMNSLQSYALLKPAEPNLTIDSTWAAGDQQWSQWVPYSAEHGCTGDDITCEAAYNNTPGSASSGNRRSKQYEDTYAFYAQADFAHDTFLGFDVPIDGNIGVRVVRTNDTMSAGLLVMPFLSQTTCTVGSTPGAQSLSCADWTNALAFLGTTANQGATVARPAVKSGYTNILPSFNVRAKLSDSVQARFAYYETIVRPDFAYTYSSASLGFNFYDTTSNQYGMFKTDPSGYGGNPYLKPMHATNYDASLEWYFSASGSVTLSLFHKDLSNYIFTETTLMPITGPAGSTMNFNYTTYVNGDKGKVEGMELQYTQFFDTLPGALAGFGVQANYTKLYNSGGHNTGSDITSGVAIAAAGDKSLPLEGMSNDSYNLALLYGKYGVDARLAWNWRSKYLSSSSDANNKIPVWLENYGQLDASVFYSFMDHYKVGVQVSNITGSVFYSQMGYKDFHPRTNTIQNDRKYALVVRTNW